jgi:hypothetical protein
VVQTVVLVSVVVGAVAVLLLRIGPRRLGSPLGRRPGPDAVHPGAPRPTWTAPSAPAAQSAPEAVGAPVAAGAPAASVAPAPPPAPQPPVAQSPVAQSPATQSTAARPGPARRAPTNSGARHFHGDVPAARRAHTRR